MSSIKHSKKRNSGLIYEFLVRQMGLSLLEGDRDTYERSLGIVRRYFSDSTPIGSERVLFDVIRQSRGVTEAAAWRTLDEV